MKSIYLSFYIDTAKIKEDVDNAFKKESILKELGYEVINPLRLEIFRDAESPEDYSRLKIPYVLKCEEIAFLENWRSSKESILEYDLAKRLKIPMKFFSGDTLEDAPLVGFKLDSDKLDWSLLDLSLLHGALRVLKYGEKKYESHNWQKVDNGKKRYFNALLRHMEELQNDKQFDEESGCDVIDHVIVNALFLKYFIEEEKRG